MTAWYAGGVLPFIAVTDKAWFDFLASRAEQGRVDEVNFWSPSSTRPMSAMVPGTPVFFRLKHPWNAIAGYGFYAHHAPLALDEAWRMFDWRNGDPHEASFLMRIGRYRNQDLIDPMTPQAPLGCTVLRDARFWAPPHWLPWSLAQGWAPNIVRGARERDPERAALLLRTIQEDADRAAVAEELSDAYHVVTDDARLRRTTEVVVREGKGTFRTRLLLAYDRSCAVTGEHTEPVLDAAHIQPYLGPQSNHVQNGLLLTQEFHTLFDAGLVAITPDYRVRVSRALRTRWNNGRRYYAYDGKPLARVPADPALRPSQAALAWHLDHRFAG